MKIRENIRVSLRSVKSNLLRTILTLLIIAFGILALVGILAAVDVMINELGSSFSGMGANTFAIERLSQDFHGGGDGGRQRRSDPITFREAAEFKEKFSFPSRTTIYMYCTQGIRAQYKKERSNPNLLLYGVDENYLIVKDKKLQAGRFFSQSECQYGAQKVIIGADISSRFFGKNPDRAINQTLSIENRKFQIIGVLESKGSNMNQREDKKMFIPLLNAKNIYGSQRTSFDLDVQLQTAVNMDEAIASSIGIFRNIRGLRTRDPNDFEIVKNDAVLNIIRENTKSLKFAAIFIGGITLLGAAIGLMNIMLVSVTERTREIGVRKALGATSRDILQQFLTEALVICQLGGVIGIILSLIPVLLISYFMGGQMILPWKWIGIGILICTIVGLASGILPALKAAKLDPIESLRHE